MLCRQLSGSSRPWHRLVMSRLHGSLREHIVAFLKLHLGHIGVGERDDALNWGRWAVGLSVSCCRSPLGDVGSHWLNIDLCSYVPFHEAADVANWSSLKLELFVCSVINLYLDTLLNKKLRSLTLVDVVPL